MSKELGKIQRKILEYFRDCYDKLEEKKPRGNTFEENGYNMMEIIYHNDYESFDDTPLVKKQIVYNAIKGLKARGLVYKEKQARFYSDHPRFTNPPINHIIVSVWIKNYKLWNHKEKRWEELKNLIG